MRRYTSAQSRHHAGATFTAVMTQLRLARRYPAADNSPDVRTLIDLSPSASNLQAAAARRKKPPDPGRPAVLSFTGCMFGENPGDKNVFRFPGAVVSAMTLAAMRFSDPSQRLGSESCGAERKTEVQLSSNQI